MDVARTSVADLCPTLLAHKQALHYLSKVRDDLPLRVAFIANVVAMF